MGVHLFGPAHDGVDLLGGDLPLGGLDGGLDHREDEPLDAVAEDGHVVPFQFNEPLVEVHIGEIAGHQASHAVLVVGEDRLVVPQGVVGIEADGVDHEAPLPACNPVVSMGAAVTVPGSRRPA